MTQSSAHRKHPSRRDVLRILAVGGAAGAAWKLGLLGGGAPSAVTRTRMLMGTVVNLTVHGEDPAAAAAAAEATLLRMAELESILSRYRPDTEVGRLNATGRIEDASEPLLDVLRLAERISGMGDGAFDVTVQPLLEAYRQPQDEGRLPSSADIERALELVNFRAVRIEGRTVSLDREGMAITLDGIGKGYIVDRGVDVLRSSGFSNVFVEAGGDLMASGYKQDGVPWRIGIRNPRSGPSLQARFDTAERAAATSGDYMQPFTPDFAQHHILDPRIGRSAPELASSTVIAPDAAMADALATLTMVIGARAGRDLLESLPGCEGYFLSKDLEVTRTTGFVVV